MVAAANVPTTPVTAQCVVQAAKVEHVPLAGLASIMKVEGGVVGHVHKNADGSMDFGPMQINSRWLPQLKRTGITRRELKNNGCVNVLVGAWVFAQQLQRHPKHPWLAIGLYHSHTKALSKQYQFRVWHEMSKTHSLTTIIRHANGQ